MSLEVMDTTQAVNIFFCFSDLVYPKEKACSVRAMQTINNFTGSEVVQFRHDITDEEAPWKTECMEGYLKLSASKTAKLRGRGGVGRKHSKAGDQSLTQSLPRQLSRCKTTLFAQFTRYLEEDQRVVGDPCSTAAICALCCWQIV